MDRCPECHNHLYEDWAHVCNAHGESLFTRAISSTDPHPHPQGLDAMALWLAQSLPRRRVRALSSLAVPESPATR